MAMSWFSLHSIMTDTDRDPLVPRAHDCVREIRRKSTEVFSLSCFVARMQPATASRVSVAAL